MKCYATLEQSQWKASKCGMLKFYSTVYLFTIPWTFKAKKIPRIPRCCFNIWVYYCYQPSTDLKNKKKTFSERTHLLWRLSWLKLVLAARAILQSLLSIAVKGKLLEQQTGSMPQVVSLTQVLGKKRKEFFSLRFVYRWDLHVHKFKNWGLILQVANFNQVKYGHGNTALKNVNIFFLRNSYCPGGLNCQLIWVKILKFYYIFFLFWILLFCEV